MGLFGWLFGASRIPSGKFGQDRHKPAGEWVQTTSVVKVAGVHHHRSAVSKFMAAVAHAEHGRTPYGVELRPDPRNKHDRNAIAVDGYVGSKTWHIGFLDRDTAAELHGDLRSKGIPIAGELYSIWNGDDGYIDVNVIVLAPPGYSVKKRTRG